MPYHVLYVTLQKLIQKKLIRNVRIRLETKLQNVCNGEIRERREVSFSHVVKVLKSAAAAAAGILHAPVVKKQAVDRTLLSLIHLIDGTDVFPGWSLIIFGPTDLRPLERCLPNPGLERSKFLPRTDRRAFVHHSLLVPPVRFTIQSVRLPSQNLHPFKRTSFLLPLNLP